MTTSLQVFEFNGAKVRTAGSFESPLFCAADICAILTLGHVSKACERLDQDEVTLAHHSAAENKPNALNGRGDKKSIYVTESGLYSLIIGCEKPEAKRFKKWVTSEVLPAIRRFGVYDAVAAQTRKQTELLLAEIFPGLPSKAEPIFGELIQALLKMRREPLVPGNPPWARQLASLVYEWSFKVPGQQPYRRGKNSKPNASRTDYSMLNGPALEKVKETARSGALFAAISFSWSDWREKMDVAFGGKALQENLNFKLLPGGKK